MAILMSLNGQTSGDPFLIAAAGDAVFPASLALRTDDGTTADAVLRVAGGVGIHFERNEVRISSYETTIAVHALSGSSARNDTTIEVAIGGTVAATLPLTAITNPEIWFEGRFQARFATDGDVYNNPRGNPDDSGNGWTWALEEEPDFVPADNVPDRLDKPVGRVVRFQNAEAPRSHVPPIGVTVSGIRGTVGSASEEFTSGDSVIGMPVALGPNTYFASNNPRDPQDPPPEEAYPAGLEAMSNFEVHVGERFSGTSALGPYRGAVASTEPRDPDDRPQANGLFPLSADELATYGILPLQEFAEARLNTLLGDFEALPPADRTGTAAGRNLRTRIAHLLPDAGAPLRDQIVAATGITPSIFSTLQFGYIGKEEYTGLVNAGLQIQAGDSTVLSYFAGFQSFVFFAKFFNFHSDELCGRVHGSLSVDQLTTDDPQRLSVMRASAIRRRPPVAHT